MLSTLTDFASSRRGKWIVIAVWFLVAAVIVPLAPQLAEVVENEQTSFLPEDAESTRAVELVQQRFPSSTTPAIVVFRNPNGLTDADLAEERRIAAAVTDPEAPENIESVVSVSTQPQARGSLVSPDGTTMTMLVNISGEAAEEPYLETVDFVREQANDTEALAVKVSGPGGLLKDLIAVFEQIDGFLILVTAALVLVLLVVIYRSPVVALVPLVSVGWVFALAGALGALGAERFGLPVNGQSQGIMTVLLFGAGTDYCLFVSSRFREELVHTEDKHEAMRRAMRGVGEAIASSAGTVLVATLALLFATLRSNQSLGPLLAVAIATMLVAALTLVPALLTVLGRNAFWPLRPKYDPARVAVAADDEAHGVWSWVATQVGRRPVAFLATTAAVFVALSFGTLRLEQTFDSITALPAGTESREGFELLRTSFPAGELAPTEAYLALPAGGQVLDPATLSQVDQLSQRLATYPGVAAVSGPSRPFGVAAPVGPAEVLAAAQAVGAGAAGPEQQALFGQATRAVSPDGGVARITVSLTENPYSLAALDEIEGLRAFARQSAAEAGLGTAEVLIGGDTATAHDTQVANDRDIRVVLPIILLAIGVILGLLLRSLVAPIYLLATIVLSYAATLGLSTLVFQDLLGQDGVGAGVPFFLFVFLVALGVDYNIFLMARIREETRHHGLRSGTRRALGRTGGVITSAGIILAGTFGALMTLPLQDLFQTGFSVAVGVLIDTFIVRSLMVPAIVLLLGRWNWWPSRDLAAAPGLGTAASRAGDLAPGRGD